jgi:hypothetical protein
MMMIRPVFRNEIVSSVNGSFEPQYDIVSGGTVRMENAVLRFKNPISQEGTKLNAVNLTNLFDFDNMESMRGHRKTTQFNANGSITETITATGSSVVNARRETSFPSASAIRVVTTVFADNGVDVLRQTTVNTAVEGSITETVS